MSRRFGLRRPVRAPYAPVGGDAEFGAATVSDMLVWCDPDEEYATFHPTTLRVSGLAHRYIKPGSGITDLAQASSPAQPLYSPTGILGKPALYYTGGDYLESTDSVLAGLLDGSQAYTTFYVINRDVEVAVDGVWSIGDSGSSQNSILHRMTTSGGSIDWVLRGTTANTQNAGNQTDSAAPAYCRFVYDGSSYDSAVNNVDSLSGASNTRTPSCDKFYIGIDRFLGAFGGQMDGWIAEILIYERALTSDEIDTVETYLKGKYVGL